MNTADVAKLFPAEGEGLAGTYKVGQFITYTVSPTGVRYSVYIGDYVIMVTTYGRVLAYKPEP